jgi:two-component system sensor histidine kinase YesM
MTIYRSSLEQTAKFNSQQVAGQTAHTIDIYLQQMKDDMKLLEKELENCRSRNEVNEYIHYMIKIQSATVSIVIYAEDGRILECGADNKALKGNLSYNTSFVPELFERNSYEFSKPHVQNMFRGLYPWVITMGNRLRLSIYGQRVYLSMDARIYSILSYVDSVSIGQHGYCYVMDNSGALVYHPQQLLINTGLKTEDSESIAPLNDGVYINGERIMSVKTIENNPWRVVTVSYTDEVIKEKINVMLSGILIITLLCLLLSMGVITIFTRIVTNPVQTLVNAMGEFERSAQSFQYKQMHKGMRGIREIERLSASFGHMAQQIKNLIERVKNEEKTLRKAELRALETQINPHFLYNTLDSIEWMCERGEMQSAVMMVGALAKLFRISISKGAELIPIEKELQHAENYLVIQNFRYKDSFTYKFDVDPNILPYLCNKITLQPLIENALIHGLGELCDDGEILVTGKESGGNIVLAVRDNGVGMSKELREVILSGSSDHNTGIGIKNVNDRTHIYFGEQYGIDIESELDVGVTVTVTIPKVTEKDYKKMDMSTTP